jgi:rubrerythrin
MAFNPLKEKGMPLEKQFRNWSELTGTQYKKEKVHPYTRCRIITMNGIEVDAAIFKHQMARMTVHPDLKRALALSRRVEQQQQKAISGLVPWDETTLENTIGYEQVAVDLTSWCARNEPDDYMRQAYEFGLLEDFDHLYRYANMLDMIGGMAPEKIVGELTEIMPGRPTISEHRHPIDSIRKFMDLTTAAPATLMNVMTLIASEQQTMNFYMNVANRVKEPLLRGLYTEIGMIEEQHVSHYESLMDPRCTWLMCAVMHELHECWLYNGFMEQEKDNKVKKLWELHLDMEIGHLQNALELYKKYEKRDPAEFLPKELPPPLLFESNVEYIRGVLESQIDLTANGTEFVPVNDLPEDHRYHTYQKLVNKGKVPSEAVIKEHVKENQEDYRFETKKHPVKRFQSRKRVPKY